MNTKRSKAETKLPEELSCFYKWKKAGIFLLNLFQKEVL